jgi:hypothetical protein
LGGGRNFFLAITKVLKNQAGLPQGSLKAVVFDQNLMAINVIYRCFLKIDIYYYPPRSKSTEEHYAKMCMQRIGGDVRVPGEHV